MKYKTGNFIQISREAFKKLAGSKTSTKWLFIILNELEHRFTGVKEDFFFRSVKDMVSDSGLSRPVIIRGLKELKDLKLIETWQEHWKDKKSGKLSEKHITAIRILDV